MERVRVDRAVRMTTPKAGPAFAVYMDWGSGDLVRIVKPRPGEVVDTQTMRVVVQPALTPAALEAVAHQYRVRDTERIRLLCDAIRGNDPFTLLQQKLEGPRNVQLVHLPNPNAPVLYGSLLMKGASAWRDARGVLRRARVGRGTRLTEGQFRLEQEEKVQEYVTRRVAARPVAQTDAAPPAHTKAATASARQKRSRDGAKKV